MGIARSTYYDRSEKPADDTAIVKDIATICDEFERYGWRRVQAALRQQGLIVNHKKIRCLMREHDLQPKITSPLHSDNRQRSRSADLPKSCHRHHSHRPRPTLGGRYHICRHRRRLCLCRRHLGCLVTASGRIRHQPLDRRPADARGPRPPRSKAANHHPAACIIPIVDQYAAAAYRDHLAAHGLVGSMAGAATRTTTPRLRAS